MIYQKLTFVPKNKEEEKYLTDFVNGYIDCDTDYLFDNLVDINDAHDLVIDFTSDDVIVEDVLDWWSKFGFDFTLDYWDNSYFFGCYIFKDGILTEYQLSEEEMDLVVEDEDEETYFYNGKEYESNLFAYSEILEEKIRFNQN